MTQAPRRGVSAALANIGWLGTERVVRLGGALIVGTLVARYLGPVAFGVFNLAIAIYMLFNTVSSLGLDYLIVRDLIEQPDQLAEIMGTGFWLKAASSVVTTLAAILFTWATHAGSSSLVIMVAIISIAAVLQAFDVIDYFFQGLTLSKLTVLPRLSAILVVNLARLIAIALHASIMVFVFIFAAEIALSQLGLVISYWRYRHSLSRWCFSKQRGIMLLQESWPLILASVLIMIYMRTDQIILGYMMGNKAVGLYSAAVRVSEIWYAIPTLVSNTVMPRLLATLQRDPTLYYRRLQLVYNGLVAISVLLALFTLPISRLMITALFGQPFAAAASVLNVHIWTGVFVFIGVLGGQQLVHENLAVLEMRRAAGGAVMNLLLNIVLIPRFGIIGSALATLAAQATAAYFSDAFSSRTHHMFRMKSYALSGVWLWRGEWRWN